MSEKPPPPPPPPPGAANPRNPTPTNPPAAAAASKPPTPAGRTPSPTPAKTAATSSAKPSSSGDASKPSATPPKRGSSPQPPATSGASKQTSGGPAAPTAPGKPPAAVGGSTGATTGPQKAATPAPTTTAGGTTKPPPTPTDPAKKSPARGPAAAAASSPTAAAAASPPAAASTAGSGKPAGSNVAQVSPKRVPPPPGQQPPSTTTTAAAARKGSPSAASATPSSDAGAPPATTSPAAARSSNGTKKSPARKAPTPTEAPAPAAKNGEAPSSTAPTTTGAVKATGASKKSDKDKSTPATAPSDGAAATSSSSSSTPATGGSSTSGGVKPSPGDPNAPPKLLDNGVACARVIVAADSDVIEDWRERNISGECPFNVPVKEFVERLLSLRMKWDGGMEGMVAVEARGRDFVSVMPVPEIIMPVALTPKEMQWTPGDTYFVWLQRAGKLDPPAKTRGELYKDRLRQFYQYYAPDKEHEVHSILTDFEGSEDLLFAKLTAMYGPEPTESQLRRRKFQLSNSTMPTYAEVTGGANNASSTGATNNTTTGPSDIGKAVRDAQLQHLKDIGKYDAVRDEVSFNPTKTSQVIVEREERKQRSLISSGKRGGGDFGGGGAFGFMFGGGGGLTGGADDGTGASPVIKRALTNVLGRMNEALMLALYYKRWFIWRAERSQKRRVCHYLAGSTDTLYRREYYLKWRGYLGNRKMRRQVQQSTQLAAKSESLVGDLATENSQLKLELKRLRAQVEVLDNNNARRLETLYSSSELAISQIRTLTSENHQKEELIQQLEQRLMNVGNMMLQANDEKEKVLEATSAERVRLEHENETLFAKLTLVEEALSAANKQLELWKPKPAPATCVHCPHYYDVQRESELLHKNADVLRAKIKDGETERLKLCDTINTLGHQLREMRQGGGGGPRITSGGGGEGGMGDGGGNATTTFSEPNGPTNPKQPRNQQLSQQQPHRSAAAPRPSSPTNQPRDFFNNRPSYNTGGADIDSNASMSPPPPPPPDDDSEDGDQRSMRSSSVSSEIRPFTPPVPSFQHAYGLPPALASRSGGGGAAATNGNLTFSSNPGYMDDFQRRQQQQQQQQQQQGVPPRTLEESLKHSFIPPTPQQQIALSVHHNYNAATAGSAPSSASGLSAAQNTAAAIAATASNAAAAAVSFEANLFLGSFFRSEERRFDEKLRMSMDRQLHPRLRTSGYSLHHGTLDPAVEERFEASRHEVLRPAMVDPSTVPNPQSVFARAAQQHMMHGGGGGGGRYQDVANGVMTASDAATASKDVMHAERYAHAEEMLLRGTAPHDRPKALPSRQAVETQVRGLPGAPSTDAAAMRRNIFAYSGKF